MSNGPNDSPIKNALYVKKIGNAFCTATTLNVYDYFSIFILITTRNDVVQLD